MIRQLMPWLAVQPNDVTVLTTRERRQRRLLTKRMTPDGVTGYDRETVFAVRAYRLDGPDDLPELLGMLVGDPYSAPVRGVLKPEAAHLPYVLRRSRTPPERFAPAARCWIMVDCDGMPRPPGVDPVDPLTVGGALRRTLPSAFRSARAVMQLSSPAGLRTHVVKGHLWFWCDRPLTDEEAKAALKGAAVDTSFFHPVGLHYTADPIFADDIDDPCVDGRLALLPGLAEVEVPELAPEKPRLAFIAAGHGHGRAGAGGAERYAEACLRRLALAPEGRRHPTCIAISCRLLAIAKAGQLDPLRVAARIKGVMLGKGFDGRDGRDLGEVDRILEWAWQTVAPEELQR